MEIKSNCIYKLTSPSGKIYIGQTVDFDQRMKKYKFLRCKDQPKIYSAILKYGWDSIKSEVIDNYFGDDPDGLDTLETYYITHFDCILNGYNCCPVGGNCKRVKFSESTRSGISSRNKNRSAELAERIKINSDRATKNRAIEMILCKKAGATYRKYSGKWQ